MTDNLINLDDHRPHVSAYVACLECGKDWFAAAPADTLHFECPACSKLSGVVVEPSSPEFLNAFFRGVRGKKENTKRTMVVLNAQTINLGAMYGMGAGKLAERLDLPMDDAKALLKQEQDRVTSVKGLTRGWSSRKQGRITVSLKQGRIGDEDPQTDC